MKKKILLIGSSGELGSTILKSNIFSNILAPTRKVFNLLNLNQMKKFLLKKKIEIIINCAALARIKDCEKDKNLAIENNILGTLNLVKVVKLFEKKYKKKIIFIQISSDAVYPSISGNYNENSELGPYNAYGWTKLASEFLVQILDKYIIIRTRFYNKKLINYKHSADDIFTSQIEVNSLPKFINYLILDNFFGIINVGEEKKSDFEIYKKINPKLKIFKRKDLMKILGITIAKDSSLDLKKFNNIRKKYE